MREHVQKSRKEVSHTIEQIAAYMKEQKAELGRTEAAAKPEKEKSKAR
jgi:hypothetical protein